MFRYRLSFNGLMKKPTKLNTLYIDFDAFFANVEKQLSSSDAGQPTGVSAFPSEHSAIIAQCYVAKAFGIHRGMKLKEARALCPNLRVIAARLSHPPWASPPAISWQRLRRK